MKIIKTETLA